MRRGILETVASIVTFGVLIGVTQNYYLLIAMFGLVFLFMGYGE